MKRNLKHILAALAGIVCLIIYILTLHPTVGFIDSGELAAVVYTFGVPHPTGYPVFLLIGYIVSHLPLGGSVIYRLNLLSAIETMAAIIVMYYSVVLLLNFVFSNSKVFTEDATEIPRSCSTFIQSERARLLSPLAFTSPACR